MSKTPWPTKAVMSQIYNQNLWGGKGLDFYSGEGSHNSKIVQPYLNAAIGFLKAHNANLCVLDLGCGDFNIGQHLVKYSQKYIGVDIVESLIKRNKTLFKTNHLEFHCLDISKAQLPKADCIILRQVLQHLSNTEIKSIVKKLGHYKYIILTEHLPTGNFTPNKDIISGQGIRLKHNSGVNLLEAPFYLKIKAKKILNTTVLEGEKGEIVTALYTS